MMRISRKKFFLAVSAAGIVWFLSFLPLLFQLIGCIQSRHGYDWLETVYHLSWKTPYEIACHLICGPLFDAVSKTTKLITVIGILLLIFLSLRKIVLNPKKSLFNLRLFNWGIPSFLLFGLILFPTLVSFWTMIIYGGNRYLTVAVPYLCLCAAQGFFILYAKSSLTRWAARCILILLVFSTGIYLLDYYKNRENRMWREGMFYINEKSCNQDLLIVNPDYSATVTDYYKSPKIRTGTYTDLLQPNPLQQTWIISTYLDPEAQETSMIQAGVGFFRYQDISIALYRGLHPGDGISMVFYGEMQSSWNPYSQ